MIIDMHVHEKLFSSCSRMSLEDAVTSARYFGLDALCITNHDSLDIAGKDCLTAVDFPVFVGVELSTKQGDMLAFGLESLPSFKPTAQEFIDFVADRNGFSCAAHPFRDGCILGSCLRELRGLDGVETLNGGNDDDENSQAFHICKQLKLVALGGSDAHRSQNVGKYATWFPEPVNSMRDLVLGMKSGRCRPVMRDTDGIYRVWEDSMALGQDTPLSWAKKKFHKIF